MILQRETKKNKNHKNNMSHQLLQLFIPSHDRSIAQCAYSKFPRLAIRVMLTGFVTVAARTGTPAPRLSQHTDKDRERKG
jgi:hypothetical protein